MTDYVAAALAKAAAGGAHDIDLAALRHRLDQLGNPHAGQLPGDLLEPATDVARLGDLPEVGPKQIRHVLDRLSVIKLNGGLGTSMGLAGPKSLLEVKAGRSFLDITATQVLATRKRYGVALPLLAMNSAVTRGPSLRALDNFVGLQSQAVPLDFLQGREPKLRADDHLPVEWPADPELEWCPPGHGDIYTALVASGTAAALLDAGIRWCFISNSDNLGAVPDPRIAAWVAAENVPFAMEVVRGTHADRKGGHIARLGDRIVLRETAQVPDGDDSFGDVDRWKYYNTNNLWVDLQVLTDLQTSNPGGPELPLIVNRKTVDPRIPASTPVIQLETAMGAAIGSISGALAVHVPRTRFAPVKTTDDLLVVRSDAYRLTSDGTMVSAVAGRSPDVRLDRRTYGLLSEFERRFPFGPPSLIRCDSLQVDGEVTFGKDVEVRGTVSLTGPLQVFDGTVLAG